MLIVPIHFLVLLRNLTLLCNAPVYESGSVYATVDDTAF